MPELAVILYALMPFVFWLAALVTVTGADLRAAPTTASRYAGWAARATSLALFYASFTRRLLAAGIDAIDVSVDAAGPETYAKVRPSRGGVNFYPVLERNVVELIRARDAMDGAGRTHVIVNMIDQPLAHAEVAAFIDKWKGHGADVVLIRPYHSTAGQTLQAGVSVAVGGVRRFPCRFPFTRLNVGFDREGHPVVYYCSHDWLEKTVVGTLGRDGGLRDIWQGPTMREIRRRHVENDYPPDSLCGSCPDWYLGWGRTIHGLVQELREATGA